MTRAEHAHLDRHIEALRAETRKISADLKTHRVELSSEFGSHISSIREMFEELKTQISALPCKATRGCVK